MLSKPLGEASTAQRTRCVGMHDEKHELRWTSLAVLWLRLHAFTARGPGSIPGRGTKIPLSTWDGQKKTPNQPDLGWYSVKARQREKMWAGHEY